MDIAVFQTVLSITLTELHALRPLEAKQGLTDTQREALILAYERGCFDSPRESTLEEMAEELGISQQSLGSSRSSLTVMKRQQAVVGLSPFGYRNLLLLRKSRIAVRKQQDTRSTPVGEGQIRCPTCLIVPN